MIRICSLALALTLAGAAVPAIAATQEGLINVNIEDVAQNIANDLSVDVKQIPLNVQVPVGIAANVCNVDANVLAKTKTGAEDATCKATSNNQALNQAVSKNLQ